LALNIGQTSKVGGNDDVTSQTGAGRYVKFDIGFLCYIMIETHHPIHPHDCFVCVGVGVGLCFDKFSISLWMHLRIDNWIQFLPQITLTLYKVICLVEHTIVFR
jgi:hypothetical protein